MSGVESSDARTCDTVRWFLQISSSRKVLQKGLLQFWSKLSKRKDRVANPVIETIRNRYLKVLINVSSRTIVIVMIVSWMDLMFFNWINGLNIWIVSCSSHSVYFSFKQKKWNCDILGSLNKSKMPGHCGFPLANPQKEPNAHNVPKSITLKPSILLYICPAKLQIIFRTSTGAYN